MVGSAPPWPNNIASEGMVEAYSVEGPTNSTGLGFRGQYIKRPVVLRRMVACDIELVTNLVTNLQSHTG